MTNPTSALRSLVDPWYAAPLVPVLARRRRSLVDSLEGTVIVVTGPPAEWPPDAPTVADHVVSVGWLAAAADLPSAVDELVGRLADDGWVHVIEPTSGRTSLARAQRLSSPVAQRRTGWHLGRDVPGALRAGGLVVTDVERFSMPVSSTVLQPWVQARARRRPTTPAPTSAGEAAS